MIVRFILITGKALRLLGFWLQKRKQSNFHTLFAVHIRQSLESLGPTFIKLGQMLSMRPDYIPHAYCKELEQLLDSAPTIPASAIRRRIETELGKSIHNLFQKFENTPIASASLSQVHKAVLWDDTVVAVKILRPNLEKIIRADTKLLRIILPLVAKYFGSISKSYWVRLVDQLTTWLLEEIDYAIELRNTEIMQKEMCDGDTVCIPNIHHEFCSKHVLTMDYIDGWSLNDLIRLKEQDALPEFSFDLQERIAYLGDRMFIANLGNGFCHGDFHPANIILTPDGKIYVIDFGLIQYIDVRIRNLLTLFLIGVTFGDPELILKTAHKLGEYPDDFDEKKVFMRVSELCSEYVDAPTDVMSNGQFLIRIMNIYLEAGGQLPWSIILYARTTLGFDGIILKLCPDYIFTKHSRALFVQRYIQNMMQTHCNVPKCISIIDDFIEATSILPTAIQHIIEGLMKKHK